MKPTLGRIVLFAFAMANGELAERPAVIVRTWPSGDGVNLRVLLDGTNDDDLVEPHEKAWRGDRTTVWRTSVLPADDQAKPQPGRWRWPPREEATTEPEAPKAKKGAA